MGVWNFRQIMKKLAGETLQLSPSHSSGPASLSISSVYFCLLHLQGKPLFAARDHALDRRHRRLTAIFTALASPFWGRSPTGTARRCFTCAGFSPTRSCFLHGLYHQSPCAPRAPDHPGHIRWRSTTGMILISSGSRREEQASNMGIFQAALTLGPLLGPPVGTFAAALIGYETVFWPAPHSCSHHLLLRRST